MSTSINTRTVNTPTLTFCSALLACLLLLFTGHGVLANTPRHSGCGEGEFLNLNTTVRQPSDGTSRREAFLRLKTPGVLTLFVSTPWESPAPRLTLLGCDGEPVRQGVTAFRETPQELMLNVEMPGDLRLRIESQDLSQALPDYRLRVTFAAALWRPDEILPLNENPPSGCGVTGTPTLSPQAIDSSRYMVLERGTDLQRDVDPWDCDIIEGNFSDPGVLIVEEQEETVSSLRASIYRDGDCAYGDRLTEGTLETNKVATAIHSGRHRLLLEPLDRLPVRYALGVQYFALCHLGELDDHADHPLCSSELTLGSHQAGTMSNPAGDDEDFFTFRLGTQQTILIKATEPGVGLELFDERGQRLDAWEASRDAALGPLVRRLVPGRYYVRAVGVGSWTGKYGVFIDSLGEI